MTTTRARVMWVLGTTFVALNSAAVLAACELISSVDRSQINCPGATSSAECSATPTTSAVPTTTVPFDDASTPPSGGSDASVSDGGDAGNPGADSGTPGADAGPTWTVTQTPDAKQRDLMAVWGSGADDVYAVGIGGAAYRRVKKGAWQAIDVLGDAGTMNLSSIWGTSATNVYVAGGIQGSGAIFRYDGGGWTELAAQGTPVFAIWGSGANDIYAVGPEGLILHSSDGVHFTPQTSGTAVSLLAVWGSGANDVYAVGGVGGTVGTILHTTNGGTTWEPQDSGANVSDALDAVWGPSAQRTYVANLQQHTLIVRDGGITWGAGPASPPDAAGFYGIWGTGASDFYAVGATTAGGLIAHFDGTKLTAEPVALPDGGFTGVWGSSASDVYAVGSGGAIAHKGP